MFNQFNLPQVDLVVILQQKYVCMFVCFCLAHLVPGGGCEDKGGKDGQLVLCV